MNRALVTVLTSIAFAVPAAAQQSSDNTFTWDGKMAAGSWLRIRNLNGSVHVDRADGDVAQVRGEKTWRRGDPRSVRFQVVKDGENVTVCALWDEDDRCDETGYHSHGHQHDEDNDVSVRFTVRLPKGVKVDAGTVNGSVTAELPAKFDAELELETVNGNLRTDYPLTVTGRLDPHHIRGTIGSGGRRLRLKTVNGSIELRKLS